MSDAYQSVRKLFDLTGRVALVTGATGHLGRALAEALAEAGARVVVSSRDLDKARALTAQLPGHAERRHVAVSIDHMDEASIQQGFTAALAEAARIDILVSNAHEGLAADWRTVTAEQFTSQMQNATGYFLLARALHDHAVDRGMPASVILLGSMYGLVGSYPDAYEGICAASPAAYQALKGGVIQLTRHLAVYWGADRVRVNCLSPGPFPAPQANSQLVARLERHSPLGRMGTPDELKGAVLFLASDASSYMTGQNLVIDGGWTAW